MGLASPLLLTRSCGYALLPHPDLSHGEVDVTLKRKASIYPTWRQNEATLAGRFLTITV